MEQIPAKRTKTAEEKFCSECGEIIKAKAEICPQCGVRQLPVPGSGDLGTPQNRINFFCGNLVEKFSHTAGIAFLSFALLVILVMPPDIWVLGPVIALIPAVIAGVAAMILPTARKIIYLPISIIKCLLSKLS